MPVCRPRASSRSVTTTVSPPNANSSGSGGSNRTPRAPPGEPGRAPRSRGRRPFRRGARWAVSARSRVEEQLARSRVLLVPPELVVAAQSLHGALVNRRLRTGNQIVRAAECSPSGWWLSTKPTSVWKVAKDHEPGGSPCTGAACVVSSCAAPTRRSRAGRIGGRDDVATKVCTDSAGHATRPGPRRRSRKRIAPERLSGRSARDRNPLAGCQHRARGVAAPTIFAWASIHPFLRVDRRAISSNLCFSGETA